MKAKTRPSSTLNTASTKVRRANNQSMDFGAGSFNSPTEKDKAYASQTSKRRSNNKSIADASQL